jgi:hypothetical protein
MPCVDEGCGRGRVRRLDPVRDLHPIAMPCVDEGRGKGRVRRRDESMRGLANRELIWMHACVNEGGEEAWAYTMVHARVGEGGGACAVSADVMQVSLRAEERKRKSGRVLSRADVDGHWDAARQK